MTIGPAGSEKREPVYLPPSPHEEMMAQLRTMTTLLVDLCTALEEQGRTLQNIDKHTHESMVRLKMIRPSDKAERARVAGQSK